MRRMFSEKQIETQITSLVEGGTLDNAKPIYCHPIYMFFTTNEGSREYS